MTYRGHIRNRALVLDEPLHLPDGAEVMVEVHLPQKQPGDPWAKVQADAEKLTQSDALAAQEVIPPAPLAAQRVPALLSELRRQNFDAPFRCVPSGDGGIVFEWIDAARRQMVRTVEISADGQAELCEFTDNRLTSRHSIG